MGRIKVKGRFRSSFVIGFYRSSIEINIDLTIAIFLALNRGRLDVLLCARDI